MGQAICKAFVKQGECYLTFKCIWVRITMYNCFNFYYYGGDSNGISGFP